jgi:hypothetical protein
VLEVKLKVWIPLVFLGTVVVGNPFYFYLNSRLLVYLLSLGVGGGGYLCHFDMRLVARSWINSLLGLRE